MSDPQLKPAIPGHGRTSRSPAVLCASFSGWVGCVAWVACVGRADGAPVQPDTRPSATAAAASLA